MKHRLLSLLVACCMAMTGFSAVNYVLNESFENGIPAGWTQEVLNDDFESSAWAIDDVATNPNGAADGDHRLALRSNGENYQVRLITPELDLTGVNAPQLSFAYAQFKRNGVSDSLFVYFRPSADAAWQSLRKLGFTTDWVTAVLDLPAAAKTATCQFAFDGMLYGGYGVVMDAVRVFPASQCTDAVFSDFYLGATSAFITWEDRPSRQFELIVSTASITNLSTYDHATDVFYANDLEGTDVMVEGLNPTTKYYVYLRTDCDDNESGHTNWISTSFTTAIGVPYAPVLDALPSTWKRYTGPTTVSVNASGLTTTTSGWTGTTSTTVLGTGHLYANPSTNAYWVTTPAIELSVDANATVAASFDLAYTGGSTSASASSYVSSAKFHVYVAAADGETWTLERTIAGSNLSNEARTFHVLLDAYKGTSIRLAFVAEGKSSSAYMHFGKLSVDEVDPSCLGITDLKPVTTSNSINLSWTVTGSNTNAVAVLSSSATFADTLDIQNVSVASASFTGLEPATTYYVSVRQVCEAGNTLTATVKTPCEASTITKEEPWTEGFEGYTTAAYNANGVIPDCWSASAEGTVNPHVVGGSGSYVYTHTGSNALSFYGNGNCYAVLPGFDNALNTLQISFWARMESSTNGTLTLGYITAGDVNMNTFTPIEEYTSSATMVSYETELGALPADAEYLVFRWYYSGQWSCCIDDITISLLPTCRKIQDVTVGAITGTSAEVAFAENGAAQYEVLVVSQPMNPDTLQNESLVAHRETVTASPLAISDLTPASVYYVYVRALCGEEDGAWSAAASFATECGVMTITQATPWTETFESYAAGDFDGICWFNKHSAGSATKVFTITTTTNGSNSTHQLQLPDMNDGNMVLAGLPQMYIEEADAYTFALDVYRNDSYSTKTTEGVRIFASQTDTIDDTAVELAFIPRVYSATGTNVAAESATGWYTYEFTIPIAGDSVRILLQGESRFGASTYMDNFQLRKLPSCRPASSIALTDVTANEASLSYNGVSSAQQYQIVVATESIDPATANLSSDTIAYNEMVYTTAATISNLEGDTHYYVYIRSYCGGEDYSAWSDEFAFKTTCTAVSPAAFGVESFDDPASIDCWTFGFTHQGTSTANAYAERATSQVYGAYIKLSKDAVGAKDASGVDTVYSDGAYAISPMLDVEDIRDYQVTFDAATFATAATNYKRLDVGIVINPAGLRGLSTLKTIELDYAADSTALKSYTVSFKDYRGDMYTGEFGKYVFFRLKEPSKRDSTNSVLIDNVRFLEAATCQQILETKADTVGAQMVQLSWEAPTGVAEYEVMVSTVNSRQPDTLAATTQIVSQNSIEWTGLESMAVYYAYVRAICGEGDTALWSNSLRFRTTQMPVELPYSDDFEDGNKWELVNGTVNNWELGTASKKDGEYALYISNNGGTANSYTINEPTIVFATKSFNFDRTGKYTFKYDWLCQGESNYDYLRVALAPITTELTADVVPSGFGTSSLPEGWIALDGGSKLNLQNTWQSVVEDIQLTAGVYTVVLAWKNDNSTGTDPAAAIDNFSIEFVACERPLGLSASVTPGSGTIASLIWEKGEANEWTVEYATDADFTNAQSLTVNDTIADLTELTPETKYYARVKAICAEDSESDWSAAVSFTPTNIFAILLNDGTETNSYVPIYGMYVDDLTRSQFILPAAELAGMKWGYINTLTFYASTENTTWSGTQFEVYMAEVPDATLSALQDWSALTKVMNAAHLQIDDHEMTITLDEPYQYEGGNLLIGIKQTMSGTYTSCSWYGVSATGASFGGYGTSNVSQKNFLPKTYIEFTPGEEPACVKIQGLGVDSIVADSARLFVDDLDVHGYEFIVASAALNFAAMTAADSARIIFNDSILGDTALFVDGLAAATPYYVYARALCDEGNIGPWSTAVSFISACDLFTITEGNPWMEGFEAYEGTSFSASGVVPACWDVYSTSTVEPHVIGSGSYYYVHNGTKSLTFYGKGSNYAVLPEFTNDLSELQISFWMQVENTSKGSLSLGYITANDVDMNTFQAIATYTSVSGSMASRETSLATVPADAARLVFCWNQAGTTNYSCCIDDIKLGLIPSCLPVEGVAIDSISVDSARIRFNATDNATYDIAVASAQLDMYHLSAADSAKIAFSADEFADTILFAEGLQPATTYYVYVRTHCGASSISEWTEPVSFVTGCAAITITKENPWSEDFEGYEGAIYSAANGVVPNCWDASATNSSNIAPHVIGSGSYYYKHSGTKALTFYGSGNCYAVLPEFANALNTLQLNFWMQTESATNGTLTLGYITADDVNLNTFDSITSFANANGSMAAREVDLSSVPAEAARLVFRWYYSGQWSCCIDDVELKLLPDCKKVQDIALSEITAHTAQLTFTLNGAPEYDVLIATKALNPDTLTTDAFIAFRDTVINDTVVIAGLDAQTTFYAYVRALCDEDVRSEWQNAVSFTTACSAVEELPYAINFEDETASSLPACWTVARSSGSATDYPYVIANSSYSTYAHAGTKAFAWGTSYSYSMPATTWASLPEMAEDINNLKMTFWYRSASSYYVCDSIVVGVMTDPANTSTFVPVAGFQPTSTSYVQAEVDFSSYTGTGKYITFKRVPVGEEVEDYYGYTDTYYTPFIIDDIEVSRLPSCREIKTLNIEKITSNSAEINFVKTPSPEYELIITLDSINPDTVALVADTLIFRHDTITIDTIALAGLTTATDYYVYLRGLCSETEQGAWASKSFRTMCLVDVPYTENFDNASDRKPVYAGTTTYMIPSCWNEGYTSTSYVSYIQSNTNSVTCAYSGTSALRLYSYFSSYYNTLYASYVVLPELNADLDTLQLTFKARAMTDGTSVTNYASSTYAHSIKIGTMTDPNDFATFQLIDTYVLEEVATAPASAVEYWEDVTIYLQGATGKYIALVSDFEKSNYVWIDDVEVSRAPECIAPNGLAATLTMGDGSVADLTWYAGDVTEWVLQYATAADFANAEDTTILDAAYIHLEGLTAETTYYARVKAVCGAGNESGWSRAISFTPTNALNLTLNEGTSTNDYVPVYGLYVDDLTRSQFIIPAADLAALKWNILTQLTFYSSNDAIDWGAAEFEVYIDEVSGTTLSALTDWSNLELVKSAGSLSIVDGQMIVTLDNPYQYTGGNLLIGFKQTTTGTYASCSWYGVTASGASYGGYEGSYSTNISQQNFLPKTTIDFTRGVAPTCDKPTAPTISDITPNSAIVRWDTIAPAYQVALIQGLDTIKQMVVAKDTLLLENLSGATSYLVQIRAFCTDNDSSLWSAPVAFTTECAPIATLPWSEDFENMPAGSSTSDAPLCWDMLNANHGARPYVYITNSSSYKVNGDQSLFMETNSNSSDGFAILPPFAADMNTLKVTFTYRDESASNSGQLDFGYMTDITDASSFVSLGVAPLSATATEISFNTTAIPAALANSVRLAFRYGHAATSFYYVSIDDIRISVLDLNCMGVEALVASQISTNGARLTFRFTDGQEHTAHVAISQEAAFDPATAMLIDTIADSTYYFNVALESRTTYYMYARQDCGEGNASAWEQVAFRTDCEALTALPWSEGFEEMEKGNSTSDAPECWSLLNANQGDYPYVYVNNSSAYVQTGSQSLYFVSNSTRAAYAILPDMNVPMDQLQVSFAYRNEGTSDSNGTLSFGYMTDKTKGDSYVELVSCPRTTTFTTVSVATAAIPQNLANSVRLAFRYTGGTSNNYYAAVDDIRINSNVVLHYDATICDGNDYVGSNDGNSLYITPDEYHVGLNEYAKTCLAPEGSGQPDTLYTLSLNVMAIETLEDSVVLCEGEQFSQIINGADFTFVAKVGMPDQRRYVDNGFGCENIVILHIIAVNPKVEEHIYDSVALGEQYEWHGEIYVSATDAQFDTLSMVTGCDSTVYLHLSVYQKEEALHGVHAQDLLIAPNPVHVGEPIRVLNDFLAEDLKQARIEIYSTTGALYYVQHGADQPFILPAIEVSGMYYVRVLIDDQIYLSTLLVQ